MEHRKVKFVVLEVSGDTKYDNLKTDQQSPHAGTMEVVLTVDRWQRSKLYSQMPVTSDYKMPVVTRYVDRGISSDCLFKQWCPASASKEMASPYWLERYWLAELIGIRPTAYVCYRQE